MFYLCFIVTIGMLQIQPLILRSLDNLIQLSVTVIEHNLPQNKQVQLRIYFRLNIIYQKGKKLFQSLRICIIYLCVGNVHFTQKFTYCSYGNTCSCNVFQDSGVDVFDKAIVSNFSRAGVDELWKLVEEWFCDKSISPLRNQLWALMILNE